MFTFNKLLHTLFSQNRITSDVRKSEDVQWSMRRRHIELGITTVGAVRIVMIYSSHVDDMALCRRKLEYHEHRDPDIREVRC